MKIMASDFDGTLFFRFIGDGKGFKDEDLEAIKKFQEAGHRLPLRHRHCQTMHCHSCL